MASGRHLLSSPLLAPNHPHQEKRRNKGSRSHIADLLACQFAKESRFGCSFRHYKAIPSTLFSCKIRDDISCYTKDAAGLEIGSEMLFLFLLLLLPLLNLELYYLYYAVVEVVTVETVLIVVAAAIRVVDVVVVAVDVVAVVAVVVVAVQCLSLFRHDKIPHFKIGVKTL